jgi:hypothetical protein
MPQTGPATTARPNAPTSAAAPVVTQAPTVPAATSPTTRPAGTSAPTLAPRANTTVPLVTADAVAGSWGGVTTGGQFGPIDVRMDIAPGCRVGQDCGFVHVKVPAYQCLGDFILFKVTGATYEFDVRNFQPPSDPTQCREGAGEFLTPQPDGSLLYTTNYNPGMQGILRRVPP